MRIQWSIVCVGFNMGGKKSIVLISNDKNIAKGVARAGSITRKHGFTIKDIIVANKECSPLR